MTCHCDDLSLCSFYEDARKLGDNINDEAPPTSDLHPDWYYRDISHLHWGKQEKTKPRLPREFQPDFLFLQFWIGDVNLHLEVRKKATHVDADKQGTTVGKVCFPQLL